MRKLVWLLAILPLFVLKTWAQSPINLTISNIKNTNGSILISVFNSADGFPSDDKKAIAKYKIEKISGVTAKFKITGLKPGKYAVSILHDENNDQICNTNILGIPNEGIGCSNNPKSVMGPPKYKDSEFEYTGESITLHIKMKYI